MKKGIIILTALITLSLILIKPININAQTINGWAAELPTLSRVDFRSCNSTDCSGNFNSTVDYFESPYELRTFTYNTNYMTIGNNGYAIMVPYYVNKDYLYEVNYYICSNVNIQTSNYNYDIYAAGYTSANPVPHEYKLIARSGLDNTPIIDGGRTFNNCNLFTGLIAPSQDSAWLSYRIKSSSNVSNVVLSVVAVQVNQLGLYSSALDEVIKNSGFATADSVEEVQQSVNRVEEEITGEFDTPTTPSETIPGKDKIDETKEIEEEILNNLDFGAIDKLNITINPNVSTFIWNIVERIRNINSKIILLITSMIGLGLIKMILNR